MFKSNIIPMQDALKIRERFINLYVDTSSSRYVKYIKPLKATDIVYGYICGYLFDCLKPGTYDIVAFHKAIELLRMLGDKQVFVMFDIRPKENITPYAHEALAHSYTKHFSSDSVLKMSADEVIEILLKDQSLPCQEHIFGEDLYVIDSSLNWYVAFSHTEMPSGENACFVNYNALLAIKNSLQTNN